MALVVEVSVRTLPAYPQEAEPAGTGATRPAGPERPTDEGAGRLRELVLRVLEEDLEATPFLNKATLKVWRLMQDPRRHGEEILGLVRKDPMVSSRLVRLANSAYSNGRETVTDLDQALRRVGSEVMGTLLLAASTQLLYRPQSPAEGALMAALWDHSLAVATASQWLGRERGDADPQRAFLAGLLHDIGCMLALRVLEDAAVRHPPVRRSLSAERMAAIIQVHHQELGGILLEKCAFPSDMVVAARCHHAPGDLPSDLPIPLVVALADLVARKVWGEVGAPEAADLAAHALAARLGLSGGRLSALEVELEILHGEMKRLLAA